MGGLRCCVEFETSSFERTLFNMRMKKITSGPLIMEEIGDLSSSKTQYVILQSFHEPSISWLILTWTDSV